MSSAAQDEVDALFARGEKASRHPEDQDSDRSEADSEPSNQNGAADGDSTVAHDPRPSTVRIPTAASGGNTGPKGVIADARSFQEARKRELQTRQRSANGFFRSRGRSPLNEKTDAADGSREEDDLEDGDFMQRWRKTRLTELKSSSSSSRRQSPSLRHYGHMETVSAVGYLDAIEKVGKETVVVVCIYDDELSQRPLTSTQSDISSEVEACLAKLARIHETTRFVKLHYEEAEMDVASTPAVLAYKAGDLFANLVAFIDEIPPDQSMTTSSVESVLRVYVSPLHLFPISLKWTYSR
ncbi:MAG: hypothetical protein M1833_006516 [Piccolia ochrophora]|nr:MAG: hypothetical protein M1833_006516 [Piccolia ochrophora]